MTCCTELGKRYPGNFFRARGDFLNNIPFKNMEYYLQLEREVCDREGRIYLAFSW